MKIRMAVVFGGKSVEHEISIISAIQAIQSMDAGKYEITPVYMTKSNEFYVGDRIGDIEAYKDIKTLLAASRRVVWIRTDGRVQLVLYPMKKFGSSVVTDVDIVFPIVHGTNVEDGSLQGFFHTLDVPFVGCEVLASAVGMDKYVMKTVLKDNGIPVLDCLRFTTSDYADTDSLIKSVENKMSYPVIVKPVNLGSSVGIKKAHDTASLRDAVDLAFTFSPRILVEPAISNLREINCSVLGDYSAAEASECEEPFNTDEILSYEDKYIGGSKGSGAKSSGSKGMASLKRKIPADLTPEKRSEIRDMAVRTFQSLECNGVARIDFMIDKDTDKVYVNEINTIPGSLSFYLWEPLGMAYKDMLDRCIDLAFKRAREAAQVTYAFDTNVLSGVKLGGCKK